MKHIGIFAQRREYAGRLFNNLSFDYISKIEATGSIAIIIPCFSSNIKFYLNLSDAFIFPGGQDIDPSLYGRDMDGARGTIPSYDRFLLSSMEEITKNNKPILGICKGMQLINVYHGGTLKQDLEENTYHFQPERGYEKIDEIHIEDDTFLSALYVSKKLKINSIHHQAVDSLGAGLRVVARSSFDEEIEAIEHTTLPHYGVQWHPEYLESGRLFEWFVGH
ncbi:MAG: gamma-glutamyl-gamma-aminobutyrate hydrolase family protein [Candidatus Altimarinota bacterium]